MSENLIKAEKTKGKYLKKRKKKKWLIAAAVVVVVGALALGVGLSGKNQSQAILDLTDTTVLTYRELTDSISASGTVESAETTMVYSTMAYPVMAVHVEVGDVVKEGQLLAELDGKTLQNQIASQEIGLDVAAQSSAIQVQNAQDNYANYKEGLDQGLNATLNGAKTQVETAYDNYLKAQTTYERYAEGLQIGENPSVISAEGALRSARSAYETASTAYSDALDAVDQAETAVNQAWNALEPELNRYDGLQQELEKAQADLVFLEQELALLTDESEIAAKEAEIQEKNQEIAALEMEITAAELTLNGLLGMGGLQPAYDQAAGALEQAKQAAETAGRSLDQAAQTYETQQASYNATLTTVDNTLADHQTAVETAWKTYQNALTSLASTEKTVNEQLDSLATSVQAAQAGANQATGQESLRQLQETMDDTKVTAPCAGTVTAVYAEVGGSGSGLLFIIEDVDNLVVDTSVKGYDMGQVKEGLKVVIRSDATGDGEMEGVLTSIAPTANKNVQGTPASGDPIFAAEVEVVTKNTGLRIGMEAQLDYILAQEEHILAVPYDAVYVNQAGQTCVLAAVPQGEEQFILEELPVTTGLDDDLDMVVTGKKIEEGLRVINEPNVYLEYLGQVLKVGTRNVMFAMMG